jgi:hypothetical protein
MKLLFLDKRSVRKAWLVAALVVSSAAMALAQGEAEDIQATLKDEILPPALAEFQIRQYIANSVAPLPKAPATSQEWTTEATHLRHHLLDDVVYHGWPKEWVNSAPKFEEIGVIQTPDGYRIHRLLYEIVPGFKASALLYEPDHLSGKAPGILNLAGHDGPSGYAYEFKQKRCITYAKHGILALNLEWFSFGEMNQPGNEHWDAAHLDLVGSNGIGIFYLAMRRGLDYLYNDTRVDRNRIGVTGLSGGGWQTIVLSALDERARATNPVAGFSSLLSRIEVKEYGDMGDVEQSATDFLQGSDYSHLVALLAPRPALLTFNGEDDCCFRATIVKPRVFDAIQPFFALYGKSDAFSFHENADPGNHNYQLDNRLADYRFFTKQFGLPPIENEDGVAAQVKSYEELVTQIPADNLTILDLARKLGQQISRDPIPSDAAGKSAARSKLKEVVRYKPVEVHQAWPVAMTKHRGLQSLSYLFEMDNGLSASGILLRSVLQSSDTAPVTIALNDEGKEASSHVAFLRSSRGEQVLALDLMFMGSGWKPNYPFAFAQMVDGIGDRPLGMQAAQLISIAHWAAARAGVLQVRLDVGGMRNQAIALVAASLEPQLFSEIAVQGGIHSFRYALDLPVAFDKAPELFCLDLYKDFDIDSLQALAAPAKVESTHYLELPQK